MTSSAIDAAFFECARCSFLGRPADTAGEQLWLNLLQTGRVSFGSVAEAFLSSDEYFAHVNPA